MVGVVGSSPIAPTNKINDLRHLRVPFFFVVRQKYGNRLADFTTLLRTYCTAQSRLKRGWVGLAPSRLRTY